MQDLKLELLRQDGTPIAGGSAVETDAAVASFSGFALPAGLSRVVLRVSRGGLRAGVGGTYYFCSVHRF